MLKNKKTLPVLLIVAVLVWGLNGYRLIKGINLTDQPSLFQDLNSQNFSGVWQDSVWYKYQYISVDRDPMFMPIKKMIMKKQIHNRKKEKRKKPEIKCPQLRLTGVITDEMGKLAVILDVNQYTYFVRQNQQLDSVQISAISDSCVIISYKNKKFKLDL